MPVIEPVNTQQVLQMGSHVEKLQQTMQHLPTTTAQQLDQERVTLDEQKRHEVQDTDPSNQTEPTNPDGKNKRGRLRFRRPPAKPAEAPPSASESSPNTGPLQGHKINLIV